MEQYLSQTQQQRLTMVLAPQLRQSLEFLQVPAMELRNLVRQEMEKNPALEDQVDEEEPAQTADEEEAAVAAAEGEAAAEAPSEPEVDERAELDFKEEFDNLARLDDEWRDYFYQSQSSRPYTSDDAAKRQFFMDSISAPESLQQHLMEQLRLSGLDETDRQIGELLIGSINEDGFLTSTVEDLAHSTAFPIEHIRKILDLVREFDPIGVGAYDLRDCLLIQLHRLGKEDSLAARIVSGHLEALGGKKYTDITRALKVTVEQVQEEARFIGTLDPKPGRRFASDSPHYVVPEVLVRKMDDDYLVILDNDQIPHLHISEHYRQLTADKETPAEVRSYIREKVRAGLFLIKSIGQRQQTIFNIATEIVHVQRDFFEQGITHLRPLTMNEVAQVVGIHETTVSRAIANKYMQTPRGTFEMKYFFTPGYQTADGQSVSNKTIKDTISNLVAEENSADPLSDQAMVEKLQAQGIKVARRTIAKYRDELKILPSHLRKQF